MRSCHDAGEAEIMGLKLLFVDDGSLLAPPLMAALSEHGFRIELVANPRHALADTRGKRHDAVLVNADMQEVKALSLVRALRTQGVSNVITVIKDGANAEDELAAWRAGASDCVSRALPHEALLQRLLAQVAGAKVKVPVLLHPTKASLPTDAGVLTLTIVPVAIPLDDGRLALTRIEERLFGRLWAAHGAAVPPAELIGSAWPGAKIAAGTLHVHLHQLRRKLAKVGVAIERPSDSGYRISLETRQISRKNNAPAESKT